MQSISADVFGRSQVIYQWLSILHEIHPLYQDLKIPSFYQFKHLLNSATRTYLSHSPVICADCTDSIKHKKIPHNAIANKRDFGLANRIGFEDLAVQELHIILYMRYYYNIIKIESNSRQLCKHQQSAMKVSSFYLNMMLHKLCQIYYHKKA